MNLGPRFVFAPPHVFWDICILPQTAVPDPLRLTLLPLLVDRRASAASLAISPCRVIPRCFSFYTLCVNIKAHFVFACNSDVCHPFYIIFGNRRILR